MSSRKGYSDKEKIKFIIKTLAGDSETLRSFKENPEQAATIFQLNTEEARALKSADLLVVLRPRGGLGGTTTYTFITGSTIIGSPS
jgi:hypothetical protein